MSRHAGKTGPGKRVIPAAHGEVLPRFKHIPTSGNNRTFLSVELSLDKNKYSLPAFIDSGSAGCFIDSTLARNLHMPLVSLPVPLDITALDGRPLGSGRVEKTTRHITTRIGKHFERI